MHLDEGQSLSKPLGIVLLAISLPPAFL